MLAGVSGWSQEVLSLEVAVETALANNYQIKIRKYDAQIADLQVDPAVVGRKPVIDFNATYEFGYRDAAFETLPFGPGESGNTNELDGVINTIAVGPELNLLLLDGKASKYRLEQLGTASEATRLQVQAVAEQIISAVSNTYLEMARLQSLLGITDQNIALSQNRLERARQDAEYGTSGSLQELQIEVDLKTDSATLRNQLLNYENLRRDLNRLMGRNADAEFKVDTTLTIDTGLNLTDLERSLQARNTSLQLSERNIQLAELDLQIADAAFKPTLSGYANINYTYIRDNASFLQTNRVLGPNVGLRFQYPLVDGGARRIRKQSAVLATQQRRLERSDLEEDLIKQLRNAFAVYRNNLEQLRIEQSNLRSFERNYENIQNQYQVGLATNTDLRTAQLNLNAAKNRINNYLYTIKQAEVALYLLSGQLVNE